MSKKKRKPSAKYNVQNLKPFVKGDPRINRKGAPKKAIKLRHLMDEMLGIAEGESIENSILGKIIKKMVSEATAGNMTAAKEILDRLYGKAPIKVVTDEDDQPVKNTPINYKKLSDAALREIISAGSEE